VSKATFVLIHGAWQGAWAWETIVPRLVAAGHDAIPVDLPGNGHDATSPAAVDVHLYARHVAAIIDKITGPVVVVGHSMGGTAAAQACELRPGRIALAIYLAAFLLPDGMSVLQFYERYLEPGMRGAHARVSYSDDGLLSTIDPTSALEVFYHRADPAVAAAAARRLTPQPEGGRRSALRLSPERFGQIPRVYIEALQDRSVHPPLQRRMQQLTPCRAVYSIDSDHAPQLSAPEELAALLVKAFASHARPLGADS
jgi:pimeloyl-ACP methyl ester carboxylesterase